MRLCLCEEFVFMICISSLYMLCCVCVCVHQRPNRRKRRSTNETPRKARKKRARQQKQALNLSVSPPLSPKIKEMYITAKVTYLTQYKFLYHIMLCNTSRISQLTQLNGLSISALCYALHHTYAHICTLTYSSRPQ